ncbi:MAG: PHP domain-containing protein [Eubacteriales bacterium]
MKYVDLHVHSNNSDGTMTSTELVNYANEKGLKAIALTDHDTIIGVQEAKKAGKKCKTEIISGIELSTLYNKLDIHILGLFIDENNSTFIKKLEEFISSRHYRNEKMIKQLNNLGLDISNKDLINETGDGVITRAHFARVLLNKGYISSIEEAFKKYIGQGCPAYIPREKITPEKAINLVLSAKGIPILAHPFLYNLSDDELNSLVKKLAEKGLKGIETIYSLHSQEQERYLRNLAKKYNLLISGGSDFHGSNKEHIDLGVGMGNLKVPYSIVEKMKKAL